MASKRGNLWTNYAFVFTKLHTAIDNFREVFSHHTAEHRSNFAVYILLKHHSYVTVLTSMKKKKNTHTQKKKSSDLIVFKTLRRQIAIQEVKQQVNKQK